MILSEEEARKIIDLNPNGSIDSEIAERQFQVILKGFNYLMQDESNMLYIADEVGLGKTYVALGIASLLRHFSNNERRQVYKDVILVPKRNLQFKWVKEINNFINNNYLIECNIVKSVLGSSIGDCSEKNIHHHLNGFDESNASYEVFRNSSFSISTSQHYEWKTKLLNQLPEALKVIFNEGIKHFNKQSEEIYLKRLFAYLLNISFPKIDLLIVDEAHNFKHGIGNGVSYRNQVVSRLMGVVQEEDETIIFNHFPDLRSQISQKVSKVIFLSATPIDNGLWELKNQLDCFLPTHRFKNSENINDDVEKALPYFMIRGLMKIKLKNEGEVSRNMYRHEHRRGNVEKVEDSEPQYVKDNLESIIIGLLQLKTLKHFNESNNKSFEIGMLAGFETFKTQNNDDPEFEDSTDNKNKSADHNIIKEVAESYFETFDSHLPHPKQDNLIRVLVDGFKKGNKSLIFVRRIASVVELERKITLEIENLQYKKFKKLVKKSPKLRLLEMAFKDRHLISQIEDVLDNLSSKVLEYYKEGFYHFETEEHSAKEVIKNHLFAIYNSEDTCLRLNDFRANVKDHIRLKTIKSSLREQSKELIKNYINASRVEEDLDVEDQQEHEETFGYFFSVYFSSKRYLEGFNFRKRAGTKDWYRFNIFHLKNKIEGIMFNTSKLKTLEFSEKEKTDAKRMEVVNERLTENLTTIDGDYNEINPLFKKKTFLNYLFESTLKIEFDEWLKKKWLTPSKGYTFWQDLEALLDLFQGVFRNGSGMLPAYIANCLDNNSFEKQLFKLLEYTFPEIILELKQIVIDFDKIMATNFSNRSRIQRSLYGQHPITGVSGSHKRDVNKVATQFRMPGYPYILITTDVLKEGEDLHLYCNDVYHYGIAWNPSDMEQRTGRIDRINSSSYFKLKNDGQRSFDNSLQVFYPYLADTLEVNQVAKVFNKMNDFVETFYDISIISEKDTKASTDEIVKEIPKQIKTLLESTYDFENFKGLNTEEKVSLIAIQNVGLKKTIAINELRGIEDLLKNSFFHFFSKPILNENQFSVSANINLSGRRAPLKTRLIKGDVFGSLLFSIESIICKSTELRKRSQREEIRQSLMLKGLFLVEKDSFLLVQKRVVLESTEEQKLELIKSVIKVADKLEEEYIGLDGEW